MGKGNAVGKPEGKGGNGDVGVVVVGALATGPASPVGGFAEGAVGGFCVASGGGTCPDTKGGSAVVGGVSVGAGTVSTGGTGVAVVVGVKIDGAGGASSAWSMRTTTAPAAPRTSGTPMTQGSALR